MHKLTSLAHGAVRKALGLFGFLFVLSLVLTGTASAQVVQPSYVRPSKGAPIVLATVTATSVAATYTTSAIFDWSAFAGVVITADITSGPTGTFTACRYGARVKSLGGTSTAGNFFPLSVANNDYKTSISQSWYVRVLPGYLRFVIGTAQFNVDGQSSCTYKITATPLPFDYSGQLASTNAFSTWAELPGEFTFDANYSVIRIQNVSSSMAACYIRSPSGPFYTIPRNAFRLKADTDNGDAGDGGVIELRGFIGEIRCTGGEIIVFGY
jgi:hypothetical protein